jgi:cellulose synthase/poly-beta-1,6-N-acetylglucosamine synthase-like glycosyltransferase
MLGFLFWFFVSSILYTYLGYPLLLSLFAWFRNNHNPGEAGNCTLDCPPITLLIAAYNEEEIIAEKLENSLKLDYPPSCLQILVAADGSNDRTVEIVNSFGARGVELSYSPVRDGKSPAINRALRLVRGELVIFSDANNLYEPETLRKLVRHFTDPSIAVVTGAKTILEGEGNLGDSEGFYWKYESFIKKQETRLGNCTGVVGEVLAVRRNLIEPIPEKIINDDFYLAIRMIKKGFRVIYEPEAHSVERVSASAQAEIIRRTRIVAGRYQALLQAPNLLPWNRPLVIWQVMSHKFLRPLVPFAMIGALLTNLFAVLHPSTIRGSSLIRLTKPWNYLFLSAQLLFYFIAWVGNKTENRGNRWKLLYVPTFLVNSNLAALQGLYMYISKQQTNMWIRVQRRSTKESETQ